MLSFLKKIEEPQFIPSLTGRLETTYEQLKRDFGSRLSGRIFDVDISDHTTEFSSKLPAKIQDVVRRVLDDYLKEGDEFYFQVDENVFGIFLGKATKAVAELKIQVILNELGRAIEEAKRKRKVSVKENCGRAVPSTAPITSVPYRSEKRGTLPEDLSAKEMRGWASRAMLNMVTRNGYEDFQADIERLSHMIKIHFKPLLYVPNGLLSGYVVETTDSFSKIQYREKQSQEDLAILAAAIRHLKAMAERNEYALLIVPVFLHTICDRNTRDLFNIYCHSIDPKLKRFLVLRVKGIDSEKMIRTDWEFLNRAASHCRSIIIEAPKRKINFQKLVGLNFHAVGLDISNINAPEEHLFKLINDFARFYQGKGKSTYVLGIETRSLLLAAIDSDHPYISGPAIAPVRAMPKRANYLKLEDVYREFYRRPTTGLNIP